MPAETSGRQDRVRAARADGQTNGRNGTVDSISDIEIAVLVQDGVFDSGPAAILDVLDFANAMADQVPEAPSWRATMVGLQPEVRTGAGQLVTT
jgi:hypothetical protein